MAPEIITISEVYPKLPHLHFLNLELTPFVHPACDRQTIFYERREESPGNNNYFAVEMVRNGWCISPSSINLGKELTPASEQDLGGLLKIIRTYPTVNVFCVDDNLAKNYQRRGFNRVWFYNPLLKKVEEVEFRTKSEDVTVAAFLKNVEEVALVPIPHRRRLNPGVLVIDAKEILSSQFGTEFSRLIGERKWGLSH